jgi:hypothetical protein
LYSRCEVFGRVYTALESNIVSSQYSMAHMMYSYSIVLMQYSN